MRVTRPIWIAGGVYLAAVLVVFGDVLVQGNARLLSAEGQDLIGIFLHWHEFGIGALRRGHLALWNPHVYAGAPFFASFQPGLLYPPNWLGVLLPTVLAINVGVALHFFLGGLWTYLWAAHRRLHPAASILAGLIFMLCGPHFLQLYRGHLPTLRTIVWAPLIFLAVDGIAAGRKRGWILVGVAAATLQLLAGLVQQFYYTALVVGVYALLAHGRSGRLLRVIAGIATMYAAATVLAAVQILPGLDAASESLRSSLAYELARTFAFPPENVLTLVLPGVFGDMIDTPYWGRWTLTEASLFVGAAAFLLAVYGAVVGTRERRRCSLALFGVTLVLAFGYYTPLFRVLYDYVPLFASFRGATKFVFLAALFLAMLAGVGFDALLDGRPARWPVALAGVLGLSLLVAAGAVAHSAPAGAGGTWGRMLGALDLRDEAFSYYPVSRGGTFVADAGRATARSLAIGGTTFLVLGAAWWTARRRRAAAYAIALVACIELLAYARYSRVTCDPAPEFAEVAALRALTARNGDARVLSMVDPYRAMSAGAYDIWGYDPMILTRYARFLAFSQGMQPHDLVVTPLRRLSPLFDLLRLRYVLQPDAAHPERTDVGEVPRASLVHDWRVVADPLQALTAMTRGDFDRRATVLLESPPDLPAASAGEGNGDDTVSVVDVSSDVMDVTVETRRPAILLVTDNYAKGWTVTPLGPPPQPRYVVMPADVAFRGIPLAPGHHRFRLAYAPTAFRVGAWITTVALAAYLGAVLLAFRRLWREP